MTKTNSPLHLVIESNEEEVKLYEFGFDPKAIDY